MLQRAAAIFSPSSSTMPFPVRRARALCELKNRFAAVHVGPGWLRDVEGQAGSPEQRCAELVALAMLPGDPLLIASTGGFSCNRMLPLLDYGLLDELKPTVCGFSDVSTLLLALHARTGARCLHGPTVLASYGVFGGVDRYTHDRLADMVAGDRPSLVLEPPERVVVAPALWDDGDDRAEQTRPAGGWTPICAGIAQGPAIVANLEVLEGLLATPYLPALPGSVLIVEAAEGPVERIARQLEHLIQAGELTRVSALVFGRVPGGTDPEGRLHGVLRQVGWRCGIPVLADFDIGHTDPKVTIPLGALMRIDAGIGSVSLDLLPM